jgi:putative DNA methylase
MKNDVGQALSPACAEGYEMQYRRKLPHWHPEGRRLFVTWRLFGTVPEYRKWKVLTKDSGSEFARFDRELAAAGGARFMGVPGVADCVADAIVYGEASRGFYKLLAWVVMPNHVHVVMTPLTDAREITRWLKGSTARSANQILKRTGLPFWQDESWDRWLRNEGELRKCIRYVEFNPVQAGLCCRPEMYRWSSASWQAEAPAPHGGQM